MKNRRVKIAYVVYQQRLFKVPTSVPFDVFDVTNYFEARFVDVPAKWQLACETPNTNPAFENVVKL